MSNSLNMQENYRKNLTLPKGKVLQATALLAVAGILGGGGSGAAINNLIIQLMALLIIACNPHAFVTFFSTAPRFLVALVSATLLLPILQSVPLPPAIWESLPGRDLVAESLKLIGEENSWFPMSLNVSRTIIALLSLLPPLTVLVLVWNLTDADKYKLVMFVVFSGVVMVLIGTQQLATGNRKLVLFAEVFGSNNLHGTFANRNSTGLFLDIALCALIGTLPEKGLRPAHLLRAFAIATLLVVGLILTRSRSGIALIVVPLGLLMFQLLQSQIWGTQSPRRFVVGALGIALVIGTAGAVIVSGNQRIQKSFSRFNDLQDSRPLIWADTVGSIARFWPVGSGIGSFDEVFQIDESLENLRPGRAARAHSDYLETAVESGLPGLVLLACWALFLIRRGWWALQFRRYSVVSIAIFALLALQSVLDYPLRNQTLLCVAGLMIALLPHYAPRKLSTDGPGEARSVSRRRSSESEEGSIRSKSGNSP